MYLFFCLYNQGTYIYIKYVSNIYKIVERWLYLVGNPTRNSIFRFPHFVSKPFT